jgi:hypothetical protein
MTVAAPFIAASYGASTNAYLGASGSATRYMAQGASFVGSNMPQPIAGHYGAFNIGSAVGGLDAFPVRFGKCRGWVNFANIVRTNTGTANGNVYPYGNHST